MNNPRPSGVWSLLPGIPLGSRLESRSFGLPYLCPRLSFLLTMKTSEKKFYQRKLATYCMSRCAVGQSREQTCLEPVHLHPIMDSVVLGW